MTNAETDMAVFWAVNVDVNLAVRKAVRRAVRRAVGEARWHDAVNKAVRIP